MASLSSKYTKEEIIKGGLFLHACCGPCAEYPVKELQEKEIPFALYYYNPNIHPYKEWHRRLASLEKLAELKNAKLYYHKDFDQAPWLKYKESPKRCLYCYAIRMEKVAEAAAALGYTFFSTTLLISPYQQREAIIEAGERAAAKHGLCFLDADWRDKFREGQNLAKEDDLYRQKYCGCIISLSESKFKKKVGRSLMDYEPPAKLLQAIQLPRK